MKKVLLSLIVMALILTCGCSLSPVNKLGKEFSLSNDTINETVQNISTSTDWCIGIPKIEISNIRVGTIINGAIVVHNGVDVTRTFHLSLKEPTKLSDGYEMPPYGWQMWVTIQQTEITLSPSGNIIIPITLEIPSGVKLPDKWEFQVLVEEVGNTATVQINYAQRWKLTK